MEYPLPNHDFHLSPAPKVRRTGLTLLELMVVLVILSIVATVALQSLQPQVASQRFSAASRLLDEIKSATIGPTQKFQLDGTPLISGFVADIGRLPESTALLNEDAGDFLDSAPLSELWNAECDLANQFPFAFRSGPIQPVDYSAIRLPCGWRGPYLQLPVGVSSLKDPWGEHPRLATDAKGRIDTVTVDLPPSSNELAPQEISVDLALAEVEVSGVVLLSNPEQASVKVALLTPRPPNSLSTLAVVEDEDDAPDVFRFRNVPVGLRAIVCDVNGQRHVKYVQVPHNGLTVCFDCQNPQATQDSLQTAPTLPN